jgi:hypothetical protein
MKNFVLTISLLFPAALLAREAIPPGTILPARLDTALSSKDSKPGQRVSARIMQDVPLPGGKALRAGARVTGHVTEVSRLANGTASRISFQFDSVVSSRTNIPVRTSLRALATLGEVDAAQIPEVGPDRGTPTSAWVTNQIGGEVVIRGGGHLMHASQVVGEPVADGVLACITAVPGGNCKDDPGTDNRLQALWLFSSDACGLFGYSRLTLVHSGRGDPAGVIILSSPERDFKIWSGSGLLLRVN